MTKRTDEDESTVDETLTPADPAQVREALTALAALDAEAAAAYEAVAATIEDEALRAELESFRADHLRHIEDLMPLLGGQQPPAPSLLPRLSKFAGGVGPEAGLLLTMANEELTNASYDVAMALGVDPATRAILEKNYGDEERHLDFMRDLIAHIFAEDDEAEGDEAFDDEDEDEEEAPKGA